MRKILVIILFILLLPLYSANISIPDLLLITHLDINNGDVDLTTLGELDIKIEGGYKFAGDLAFTFLDRDIYYNPTLPSTYDSQEIEDYVSNVLRFKRAVIELKDLFALPLNFTFFTGDYLEYGIGIDYPTVFGTKDIVSRMRGYVYYPTGPTFESQYRIFGTGIGLSSNVLGDLVKFETYTYKDNLLGNDTYSSDLRILFNTLNFKAELFGGASYPDYAYGLYRAGAMLFFTNNDFAEFYLQFGIPRIDPATTDFQELGNYHILVEPRMHWDIVSIYFTFFYHPAYYLQQPTNDGETMEFNLNIFFHDEENILYSGGFDTNLVYNKNNADAFKATLSPYFSFNDSGILWDVRLRSKLYPFDLADMFDVYLSIRTAF